MIFIQEFPRTSSLQQGFPLLHSALKKRKFCSKQSIHYFVLLSQLQHLDLCIGQFWMLGLLCTRKPSRDQVTTSKVSVSEDQQQVSALKSRLSSLPCLFNSSDEGEDNSWDALDQVPYTFVKTVKSKKEKGEFSSLMT